MLVRQALSAQQLEAVLLPTPGQPGAALETPSASALLLMEAPVAVNVLGDEMDSSAMTETLLSGMEPSVQVRVVTRTLEMAFDLVSLTTSAKICNDGQRPPSSDPRLAELTTRLASELAVPETMITLACSMRLLEASAAVGRRLQVCVTSMPGK
jgi:hypothetical protein